MKAIALTAMLATVLAAACRREPTAPASSLGGLKPSQQLLLPEVTLTFVEVKSDSRCPLNVMCVWAGNAVVVVTVQAPFTRYLALPVELNTNLDPKSVDFGNVTIRLDSLTPYPAAPDPIPQDKYVAYFSVLRR